MPGPKLNDGATTVGERVGTKASAKYVRSSASKARVVLDLVRGLDVRRASEVLRFSERAVSSDIAKVLQSAVANATHNDAQDTEELYVAACYADEGPTMRRFRPRARGRATRIRKRSCHITIIVARLSDDRLEVLTNRESNRGAAGRAGTAQSRRERVERSRRRAQGLRSGDPTPDAAATTSTDETQDPQSFAPQDVDDMASAGEGSASDEPESSERSERDQQQGSASDEPESSEPKVSETGITSEPKASETGKSSETGKASEHVTSPFARRDAELTPLIVAAARRMKRVLADEQNELLDTLRQSEPVVSIDALVAVVGQQAARYVDAITTELEGAAQAGAASVTGDVTTDVTRAGALGPVRDLIALNLVTPLRERLERCVADGDGDNDVITRRVRSVYREWKTQHVDNQLDDVFRLAYGRGVLVALPVGTPVRWLVDPNGPACPDAEDNSLAGVVPAGDPFPTGHVCAPAHAECRCLLGPAEQ